MIGLAMAKCYRAQTLQHPISEYMNQMWLWQSDCYVGHGPWRNQVDAEAMDTIRSPNRMSVLASGYSVFRYVYDVFADIHRGNDVMQIECDSIINIRLLWREDVQRPSEDVRGDDGSI